MYNRYIPQPDGSHQRNRVQESQQPTVQHPSMVTEQPTPQQNTPHHTPHKPQSDSLIGMLRNLLPKNLDTGDLIIILLLLLMANDCEENRNNALLTLALYFFL